MPLENDVLTSAPLYVSADGERLVAQFLLSGYENWIVAWDVTTGERVVDLRWEATSPALAWLADNRTLAIGLKYPDSQDGGIALFDTGT